MKTIQKRLLSVLLALVLALGCLPAAALAAQPAAKAYAYTSNANSNIQETGDAFIWRDDCFRQSSFLGCDHLRLLSAQVSIASGSRYGEGEDIYEQDVSDQGYNIKAMLTAMGFADVATNAYYQTETQQDSAAVAVGHRTITADGKRYTLLAVIPRSAGYKQEWAGNFNVGEEDIHAGFKAARDEDLRFVKQYIADHGITGDLKVWIAGHSRGSAVANLLGGFFAGGGIAYFGGAVSITPEDVYCYTFATPKTIIDGLEKNVELSVACARGGVYVNDTDTAAWTYTGGGTVDPEAAVYNGIRNYPFDYDLITHLPPAEWEFTYYGRVENMTLTADGKAIGTDAMLAELDAVSHFAYNAWTGGDAAGDYLTYPGDPRGFRPYTVDLKTLSLVTGEVTGEAGMTAFVDNFIGGLPAMCPTKGEYTAEYQAMLTALAGLYGMTVLQFSEEYSKNVSALIKPAILSYFAYASERLNVSEAEAVDTAINDLVAQLTGKDHQRTYAVAADTFAHRLPQLATEATVALVELADAISDGYYLTGDTSASAYAQEVTVDAFVERTMMYLGKNREAPLTQNLLALAEEALPEDYKSIVLALFAGFIPADMLATATVEDAIFYVMYACGYGPVEDSGMYGDYDDVRNVRNAMVTLIKMMSAIGVQLPGELVAILPMLEQADQTPLTALVEAGLRALITQYDEDGELVRTYDALADAADAGLQDGLETMIDAVLQAIADKNLSYTDDFVNQIKGHKATLLLPANITRLRNALCTLLFRTADNSFDPPQTLQNIATFVGNIDRIPPAHYNEVFIAWGKAAAKTAAEHSSAAEDAPAGYDPVPVPAPAAVTVPVSGEDATVNVKVEIKGDAAAIKEADIDKVLSAEEVGTVTIDVSGLKASIDEVTIPGRMLDRIAEAVADENNSADGLEVQLPGGSVSFDAEAVAAIEAQTEGKDLTLHLDGIRVTELASAQQEAVGDLEVEVVLDAYLTSGGARISDFKGGSAAVKIPYKLKDGQLPAGLVVWYVAEDGTRTQVPATYDGENIVFTVPHFSVYVVAYDAEKAAECPRDASCPMGAFSDLDPAAWYHDGVHWALENGVMNGVGGGKFNPGGATSRAMIVTILYRLEGEPMIRSGMPFSDVTESDWYAMAVSWAESRGIVGGYGNGKFGPNDPITREQLAAILYRYAQYKGQGFTGLWSFQLDYPDAGEVSGWAREAMSWMVMRGVINGKDGKLVPGGSASRAEAATMLCRFSAGAASDALSAVLARGVLRVGTTGDYRPMSFREPDTGEYWGFDAALAEDLAAALGVELEYVPTTWPTLMDDTLAGKFDLAICGITVTDARREQALMSDGYLDNGKTLLCRAEDADKYVSLEAVNRPEVTVMENPGGLNEKFARENLPEATLVIHDANEEIPGLVAAGEADVMITEILEAGWYVGQDSRLAAPLIYEPFTQGQLGVLMPKGSEALLDYVNAFLASEKAGGRIDALAWEYIYQYIGGAGAAA